MPFTRFIMLVLLVGCQSKPETAAQSTQTPSPQVPPKEAAKPIPPNVPPLQIVVVDRTNDDEKPVDLSANLETLSDVAAHSAGFSTTDDGTLAGVETHYTILVDGEAKPNADTGLLSWGVQVTVRLEDEHGLAEDLIGQSKGSIPYVRAATPNIRAVCTHVLSSALATAFRDVWMQVNYRNTPPEKAVQGLQSKEGPERWAALRRLGELRHAPSVPIIVAQLDGADAMTAHIVIGVLGRIGNQAALDHLIRLASNEPSDLAMSAIKTLWMLYPKQAEPIIKGIQSDHPDTQVRSFAVEILAQPPPGQ